ncbi:hypothetical protein [Promicromonospora soli]|uniref:Uncharacterized protein n=1 Tax=Promicromonospora soli TaxID=2035533 RepID=A0A919FM48_9MICO|nr:hypothetical protein [Promicromonospora soli]GHH68852.1 hypothetical protein GCM10017772_12750 [Promicromonospora soli]
MITALRRPWGKRAMALATAFTLVLPVSAAAAVPAGAAPATVAAPATPTVVAAPEAPAAPMAAPCPGNRIVHKPIKLNGYKIAWLNVFYNRSTGTKCAVTAHTGSTWGRWAYTQVRVWSSSSSSSVGGDYRYRTGPASVGGVRGVCVSARGSIDWRGQTRTTTVHGLCG